MAVIVPADPYQKLIRKISYSVCLAAVLQRAITLTQLYVSERQLSCAAWRDLIVNSFHRKDDGKADKKTAVEHIADFFRELKLIRVSNQVVTPLHGLEVLSILWRHLESDEQRLRA